MLESRALGIAGLVFGLTLLSPFSLRYGSLTQADPIDVSGTWDLSLVSPEGTATPRLVLIQEGEKIKGTYTGKMGKTNLTGSLAGRDIKFQIVFEFMSRQITANYEGTVQGDSMKGKARFSNGASATWTALRKKGP